MDNCVEEIKEVEEVKEVKKLFTFVRFNNDELIKLYEEEVIKGNVPKSENESYEVKIRKAYSYINRLTIVKAITKYYENIFNEFTNIIIQPNNYYHQYSKDLKIKIDEDTVMRRHKVNARYELHSSKLPNIFQANLVESGNCCGSMLLSGFNSGTGAFGKLSKIFIYMIYDIAIALRTTNLLALNVKSAWYTKKAVEKYGFKEIGSFLNRNSANIVSILSKEIPSDLIKEEIIINYE